MTQGLVPRTELLDALSSAKSKSEDHQILSSSAARLQEQLETARSETDKLKEELRNMIKRSDFEAEQKRLREMEQSAREDVKRLQETISTLNEQIRALNHDKESIVAELKVHFECFKQQIQFLDFFFSITGNGASLEFIAGPG